MYNADKIVVGVTMELPSLHLCCVGSGVSPHLPDTGSPLPIDGIKLLLAHYHIQYHTSPSHLGDKLW